MIMAASGVVLDGDPRSASRRALGNRTFLVTYVAEAQSIFGDQLARVALSVLVYELTGSAPATAATYAATFLPAIAGGVILGRVGDRMSRRSVMVGCDVVRTICFAAIAVDPDNVALLIVLVVVAVTLGPAFSAAQLGLLANFLDLDEFTAGNAIRLVTSQAAQVAGFAAGGIVVAALGPGDALAINAVTFALSAVLLRLLIPSGRNLASEQNVAARPGGPVTGATEPGTGAAAAADGDRAERVFAGLWRDRTARPLVMSSLCIGFFVVPEGLAVPFADSVGASSGQAGLLLASGALGGAVGAAILVRLDAVARAGWANVMGVLCGMPLVLSALLVMTPWGKWWVAAACWLLSGVCAAYVVQPTSLLMHAIPDTQRSRSVGVLSALLLGSQGVAVLVFGAVAAALNPSAAVGIAGGVGVVITAAARVFGRDRRRGRHAVAT